METIHHPVYSLILRFLLPLMMYAGRLVVVVAEEITITVDLMAEDPEITEAGVMAMDIMEDIIDITTEVGHRLLLLRGMEPRPNMPIKYFFNEYCLLIKNPNGPRIKTISLPSDCQCIAFRRNGQP